MPKIAKDYAKIAKSSKGAGKGSGTKIAKMYNPPKSGKKK